MRAGSGGLAGVLCGVVCCRVGELRGEGKVSRCCRFKAGEVRVRCD